MRNGIKIFFISTLSFGFLFANVYAAETQNAPSTGNSMQPTSTTTTSTTTAAPAATPAANAQSAGEAFLAANKIKPGVVTLPSGLQYKIIKQGTGAIPTATDTVTVNYAGTLIDGTEFDSSYKRGQPASFPVNAVIPGWTEALELMKVGSVWELYIPASLAYGQNGAPPVIGPNQTLIFKVELLDINK